MATDTTTETPVLSERRGSVMLITLNRPDRLNAWNIRARGRATSRCSTRPRTTPRCAPSS